jgi:hypothetical protein
MPKNFAPNFSDKKFIEKIFKKSLDMKTMHKSYIYNFITF